MDQIPYHLHNGISGNKINAGDCLENSPQDAVTRPTGGATIDTEARNAINDLITKLQTLNIIKQ